MSNFFKSRIFKIVSVSCLSLLLCFTFMFTSLNNNKNKASANELISPNTVLVLPITLTRTSGADFYYYFPSFYLSYDLSDNLQQEKHKFRFYFPNASFSSEAGKYILDYNTRAWSSSSKGNPFSVNNIGAFRFIGGDSTKFDVLRYGNIVYFDITCYQSIDYILNDKTAYVTYQRYNSKVDNVMCGFTDLTIYSGSGSIYVNVKYYSSLVHSYTDSVPVIYSSVVAFTTITDDYSLLIERAYESGYQAGVSSSVGYENGYNDGYGAGYNVGYNDGYDHALSLNTGGNGILDPILNSVDTFMDIDLFGNFSVGDLLSLVFGFILIGLFIKLFLGG